MFRHRSPPQTFLTCMHWLRDIDSILPSTFASKSWRRTYTYATSSRSCDCELPVWTPGLGFHKLPVGSSDQAIALHAICRTCSGDLLRLCFWMCALSVKVHDSSAGVFVTSPMHEEGRFQFLTVEPSLRDGGFRKHTLGAYGAKCAEPFLRYAASTSSVMSDLKELCELPVEILADILRRGDICLSSEGEVLEVTLPQQFFEVQNVINFYWLGRCIHLSSFIVQVPSVHLFCFKKMWSCTEVQI